MSTMKTLGQAELRQVEGGIAPVIVAGLLLLAVIVLATCTDKHPT